MIRKIKYRDGKGERERWAEGERVEIFKDLFVV